MVSTAPVPPEFAGNAFHFSLGVGERSPIIARLLDFVGRPRLRQKLLKLLEIIGADRTALTTEHDESHRPIELRYLRWRQRARDFLRQTKACDASSLPVVLLHVVVDLDVSIPQSD